MPIKNFLIDIVSIILLCRNMCKLNALVEDFLHILLTKDKVKAESAFPIFTERIAEKNPIVDDLNEDVQLIEETISEIEIERVPGIIGKEESSIREIQIFEKILHKIYKYRKIARS